MTQIELYANNKDGKYEKEVYVLPKSRRADLGNLYVSVHGSTTVMPQSAKSDMLRVASRAPRERTMAAI